VKKQTPKKLTLQRETLTNLEQVAGGLQLNNTVYYPVRTENCATAGCSYA